MSGTKCKQKCVQMEEELNGVCFGYEINKGGKCDIWKVRVGDLSDLVVSDDANCYTREGSIVDGVNYVDQRLEHWRPMRQYLLRQVLQSLVIIAAVHRMDEERTAGSLILSRKFLMRIAIGV